MSWFNINVNESLTSLKGQISNVSNVMHDVFTEGILEENASASNSGNNNPQSVLNSDDQLLASLETASKKIDELTSLCDTKDNEVSILTTIFTRIPIGLITF